MTFEIEDNSKYHCIAIRGAPRDRSLKEPIAIDENVWILFESPLTMNESQTIALGTIQAEQLSNSNLVLLSSIRSENPGNNDHENKSLVRTNDILWYSTILNGMFSYENATTISGFVQNREHYTWGIGELETFYKSHVARSHIISVDTIERIKTVYQNFIEVNSAGESAFVRLRKGMRSWLGGMKEKCAEERLHRFVRALEAIIVPEIGRTRRQFIGRSKMFLCESEYVRPLLEEFYDLRSAVEHLNNWENVLEQYPKDDREKVASIRSFQMETMICSIYRNILKDQSTINIFLNDTSINDFWRAPHSKRVRIWTECVDLFTLDENLIDKSNARYITPIT